MAEMRRITVVVPAATLDAACQDGRGITETVREALRDLAHKRASQRLLALRGTLDLGIDLGELRKDKREP